MRVPKVEVWTRGIFVILDSMTYLGKMRPVPSSSLAITCRPRSPKNSYYLSYFKFLWILGAFCIDDYLIWARPSCTPLSAVWRYFWICKYSFGTRCVFLPFLNDWLMFITTLINLFSYIFQVLHMRKLTVKWKIYSMSDSSTTFVTTFSLEPALLFVYSSSSVDDSGGRSGIVANPSSRTASPSRCLTLRIRR